MKKIPALLLFSLLAAGLHAQPAPADLARREAADLAGFEHRAVLAKELGATHVVITEGIPLATWESDAADPYPAWYLHHASLLKIFPSPDVAPFVDAAYAAHAAAVLESRCAVLRKLGLKAVWNANEPAVMPEAFFTAHPELRGPRIDQPNRSRKAHFAPSADEPEVLRMYRESMQLLLQHCPEVELFNWVTTDAGSGFDWTPSLYPGINGNSNHQDRPMSDRVAGFLINAQEAARAAGHPIEIALNPIAPRQWMIPTFSPDVLQAIVRKLPRGLAVQGREGPDGRPFAGGGTGGGSARAFYPVVGLVVPSLEGEGGRAAAAPSGRVIVSLGDETTADFTYRLLKATRGRPMRTLSERIAALRAFAAQEVGEGQADNLVEAWSELNDVERNLAVLDFGGLLRFGHVLNRWITRPMVPLPSKLKAEDIRDYRRFLFQAKDEDQAADLVDIQGMRMYEGWGAHLLFQRAIETTLTPLRAALGRVERIRDAAEDPAARAAWALFGQRLQAVAYLLQSADNMVAYQAQLDRVAALQAPSFRSPEENPVLGTQSGWDRTDLMATARREIDTMVNLRRLLLEAQGPLLDLAPTPAEETIMRLGPDVSAGIKHKIDVMNAHWLDYDAKFTKPNP